MGPGVGRLSDQGAQLCRWQRRDGDDDRLDIVFLDDVAQVVEPAEHGNARHGADAGIIVEEADWPEPVVRRSPKVSGHRPGRRSTAHQEGRQSSQLGPVPVPGCGGPPPVVARGAVNF